MTIDAEPASPATTTRSGQPGGHHPAQLAAGLGPTLALTATLAIAGFTLLMSLVVLVSRPGAYLDELIALGTPEQNQSAKTLLYVVAFAGIVPLAILFVPRLADRVAAGPNARGLPFLAAALPATLAAAIIIARLSKRLPWGDGLAVVLACTAAWCVLAGAVLARAAVPRPWPQLTRLGRHAGAAGVVAAVMLFGTLLAVSKRSSIALLPFLLGGLLVVGVLCAYERISWPRLPRRLVLTIEGIGVLVLLLAIPDLVVFNPSPGPTNDFFPPGIIIFHQDFLLGPANQLLRGGGALLVNVPTSQYGVGSIYFLAGWFHLLPIGYGTYGLLDDVLTALFYVGAYGLLRLARVSRPLASAALAVAVVALIYSLHYDVGQLPQQGPLRFGLPMVVILAATAASRWPAAGARSRAVALAAVGVSAVWALEAFAYTSLTFLVITALETSWRPAGQRRRWLARQLGSAALAVIVVHLILALGTLIATGQLPDWGQYLAYVQAFVLGGQAGQVVYGFEQWSPGLAVGAVSFCSAAAIVLLLRRAPALVRAERTMFVALAGSTAYAIAILSYTDNRSSTYLLAYNALPTLIVVVLWLSLLLRSGGVARSARVGGLALPLLTAVLLIAAAWPGIGDHFSRTALAHAYPGGGLRTAVHRLLHPPAADPRAPVGERLVKQYISGPRALVLLPETPDLATEILIRSGRANTLSIGDPKADGFVPSVWTHELTGEIARLRPGTRLLMSRTAQSVVAALHADPSIDPLTHPIDGAIPQEEWILRQLDLRFVLRPIAQDPEGFVVAELVRRPA